MPTLNTRKDKHHVNRSGWRAYKKKMDYNDPRYRRSRKEVFERDHYTCQLCSKAFKASSLQCDHVIPLAKRSNMEDYNPDVTPFDPNEMQTLCKQCHKEKTIKEKNE
jgi:5-methylcytosine-specific restriction endonuclease McrA